MRLKLLTLSITFIGLVGCAPRGEMTFADAPSNATIQSIHVATERQVFSNNENAFGDRRSSTLQFGVAQVSIPPNHIAGNIEWPRGQADPTRHFVVDRGTRYKDITDFAAEVTQFQRTGEDTMLFVHGFNVNNAEAVYRLAQIKHDYKVDGAAVLYS